MELDFHDFLMFLTLSSLHFQVFPPPFERGPQSLHVQKYTLHLTEYRKNDLVSLNKSEREVL